MKTFSHFIGIDISKETLDFALVVDNIFCFHQQVENTAKGINIFIKELKKRYSSFSFEQSLFCMEHRGIYNNILLKFLHDRQTNIWVEQATQIKLSMGISREKNDKIDAQKIAFYAYKNREDVKLWQPKRTVIIELDHLTALRSRLVKTLQTLKTPITDSEGHMDKKTRALVIKMCKWSIESIKKDLKLVENKIQDVIKNDPYLNEIYSYIESVKSIGPVITAEVIITTNEFKNIDDPKKYACYAGFAPFAHSSGKYKGKSKVSQKANKKVKALFHNAAMTAIRFSKEMKTYYDTKIKEGKHHLLVMNNICNKLVHRIFACVKRKECYVENYITTNSF
jgi:transposase